MATLTTGPITLRTYCAEPLPVLGQFQVEVCYNGFSGTLPLTVVHVKGTSLLAQDWLSVVHIDWASLKTINPGWPTALDNLIF